MDRLDLTKVAPGPYSAPSAGLYGADGEMICTLGTADVTKAYRKRGDGAGEMLMATGRLLAASYDMADVLLQVEHWMSGYGTATQAELRDKVRAALARAA